MEKDIERSSSSQERDHNAKGGAVATELPVADTAWGRFVDSFKRNPNARVTTEAVDAEGRPVDDGTSYQPALAMKLKGRHLQMIAIGGSIGWRQQPDLHKT